jgi:hypothetical protein
MEYRVLLALFIYVYVDCALRAGFMDDGDMLHGSILPYIILVVDVLHFTTRCAMRS